MICSVEGCAAPARARTYCGKHYTRWRKYGDPSVFLTDQSHRQIDRADWPTERTCTRCKQMKPLADFHRQVKGAYGRQSACRSCQSLRARAWHADNAEKTRNSHFQRDYGISVDEYRARHDQQGGVCAICGLAESRSRQGGKPYNLVVDHGHADGQVRGLLCHRCNSGIGMFRDSPAVLAAAIRYLEAR